jgi:hypothetical protein
MSANQSTLLSLNFPAQTQKYYYNIQQKQEHSYEFVTWKTLETEYIYQWGLYDEE